MLTRKLARYCEGRKRFTMKISFFALISCFFVAGCQTIPWSETGPLMKLVNISNEGGECLALADLNGVPIIRNGKVFAIKSPGCKNVKDGIVVTQASSIKIQDTGVRAAIIKFPWGGTNIYRNSSTSWKFIWVPLKQ